MNVIIGQSGGPTAVINASLAGAYEGAIRAGANKVYGMKNGISGFLKEEFVLLNETLGGEEQVELLKRTPACYLGSCRYKLKSAEMSQEEYEKILKDGVKDHQRSNEYASWIMESIVTNTPYQIGGNVLNTNHLISNLPQEACVEVPCLVNGNGIVPCSVGSLPVQCAAMNMTNINVQLLTIEAAVTGKKEHIYQAAMLDPHTASELDIDTIKKMVDELIDAHGDYLPKYH